MSLQSLQNWLRATCGAAAALWLTLPSVIQSLVYVMGLDILTGLALAIVSRQALSLDKSFQGITRKVGMLLLVALGFLIEKETPGSTGILQGVAGFFIAHEGLSVCRNMNALGVPVPPIIMKALEQWQAKKDAADRRRVDA